MDFKPLATIDEIPEGCGRCFEMEGREIAVFRLKGEFYAISNVCPHQGGPLAEGRIEGDTVTCPWHHWHFNIKTGISPVNPKLKIQSYPLKQQEDQLFIAIL